MRVFVYEHTCAAGAAADSLRAEGRAMLAAVLDDLHRVPGVEPVTVPSGSYGERAFRDLARGSDFTLVIAPESGGLLEERCRWVEEVNGRLLGPSSAAVRLTADKAALAEHLRRLGVPTPPCTRLPSGSLLPGSFPAVCKPRDGAGSQATFLVPRPEALREALRKAEAEGWSGEALLQPFVPGLPASVAFLVGPRQSLALPPAAQHLSDDGRFRYRGGRLPLPAGPAARAARLAGAAVEAVPGLLGYVGVDLVLGEAADGSGDQVIEINPRLTTSYVGLRALAQTNLAGALLRVAAGEPAPPLGWRAGEVEFRADGGVL
jgi:predicted ATP-grasp superfamily ATP-dependent carboligase